MVLVVFRRGVLNQRCWDIIEAMISKIMFAWRFGLNSDSLSEQCIATVGPFHRRGLRTGLQKAIHSFNNYTHMDTLA